MTEKRLTLRLDPELWRRLRVEAAKHDVSATQYINQLLEEGVEAQARAAERDWQDRFERLLTSVHRRVPKDVSPEAVENDITLARAEARQERRARGHRH
jgi:hypothetical protein